jgi:tetratricopeptide (TPR) repeat protein
MMGESLRKKPAVTAGAVQKVCALQLLHAFVAASLLTYATPALAQGPASEAVREPETSTPLAANASGEAALDERAQRHWGSGMAYLDEGDYAKALEAFDKAFALSGRPRILLAIAVTHERRGDLGHAIASLDEYLRLAPNANNAASIRTHRDELQAQHDEQLQHMSDAKHDEGKTAGTTKPALVPSTSERSGASLDATQDPRSSQTSSTLRWTAFGVGIASGVAATVSGALAWKKYGELEDGCGASGFCSEQEMQTGRTMAWVSTVLSGVAVVGLGVGVWLSLDEPPSPKAKSAATQQVHVGLAYRPSGLTSQVSWSF